MVHQEVKYRGFKPGRSPIYRSPIRRWFDMLCKRLLTMLQDSRGMMPSQLHLLHNPPVCVMTLCLGLCYPYPNLAADAKPR